eukprot:738969-Pelagomonas_calceolata.AAC.1
MMGGCRSTHTPNSPTPTPTSTPTLPALQAHSRGPADHDGRLLVHAHTQVPALAQHPGHIWAGAVSHLTRWFPLSGQSMITRFPLSGHAQTRAARCPSWRHRESGDA